MNTEKNRFKGSALVLVIIAMVILLVTGVGLLAIGYNSRVLAIRDNSALAARAAADAGINHAIFYLNQIKINLHKGASPVLTSSMNYITASPVTFTESGQSFTYTVQGIWPRYSIASTGVANGISRTVYATTEPSGLLDDMMRLNDGLSCNKNLLVAGWSNGAPDPYAPANVVILNPDGHLTGTGTVNGTIYCQPGATIAEGIKSTDKKIITNPDTPVIVGPDPTLVANYKGLDLNTKNQITAADSGTYGDITFSNGSTLVVSGHVILNITGNVGETGNQYGIKINSNSSLVLYVQGDVLAKNGLEITNATDSSSNFKLYGYGSPQNIELKNNSEVFGIIYAPNADIEFKNSIDMYGSVVANKITTTQANSATATRFYYDVKIRDNYELTDPTVTLTVRNWHE